MIFTFYPSYETLSISLTEASCSLMCKHCYATYLKKMLTKEQAIETIKSNPGKYKSVLISGGSSPEGKVPVIENLDFVKMLHNMGIEINMHTGLIEEEEIRAIKPFVSRVSFDFVYNDDVIHEVYNLPSKTKADFEKTYLLLRRIIGGRIENPYGFPSSRVVPHVTIGLNHGEVTKGDFETIEEFASLKPTLLVIDVFLPTKGTPFENCPEPRLEDVLAVIEKATRRLTRSTLFLGCMRPFGKYREKLDVEAYRLGVKGFVLPAKSLISKLEAEGEKPIEIKRCCAMI